MQKASCLALYAGKSDAYCCDDHVPRGCSCNLNEDGIEDVGDDGRKFPCCEWDYNMKGFRVHNGY